MRKTIATLAALVVSAGLAAGCEFYTKCDAPVESETYTAPEDKGTAGVLESKLPEQCAWLDDIEEYRVTHGFHDEIGYGFTVEFRGDKCYEVEGLYQEFKDGSYSFKVEEERTEMDFKYVKNTKDEFVLDYDIKEPEWANSPDKSVLPPLNEERARGILDCFKERAKINELRKIIKTFYK